MDSACTLFIAFDIILTDSNRAAAAAAAEVVMDVCRQADASYG